MPPLEIISDPISLYHHRFLITERAASLFRKAESHLNAGGRQALITREQLLGRGITRDSNEVSERLPMTWMWNSSSLANIYCIRHRNPKLGRQLR
jgi:hypothetical protein